MDYQSEFERMKNFVPLEGSEYWSPKPGKYKVKGLSEIEDSEPFEDDKEMKPRKKLKVLVDGKELTWTFALGKSLVSTYGQLVQLAQDSTSTLLGREFTVVVVGEEQQKRFTIVA